MELKILIFLQILNLKDKNFVFLQISNLKYVNFSIQKNS
jgi:hypothetical protein